MRHRDLLVACSIAFVWLGACLHVPESDEEGDSPDGATSGGGTSSPTLHPSCKRAPALDGVHCASGDSYLCTELLVANGGCRAANDSTTVPAPGALIWCCPEEDGGVAGDASGGTGGVGGVGGGAGAAGGAGFDGGAAGGAGFDSR